MVSEGIVEFLVEYGWVILFLIAVIGALAYFGIIPHLLLNETKNVTYVMP